MESTFVLNSANLAGALCAMIRPPTSIIPPGFANHALQLLRKVQHGVSPVELIYTAHEHWPLRPGHTFHPCPTLHISTLDSSFNPPTLAHLALANSPPLLSLDTPTSALETYDARILLLSVRNADKVLEPGDATFGQRLEMMRLLSDDVRSIGTVKSSGESSEMSSNVAIAIINEPTFVGKSTVLLRFLKTRLAAVVESSSPPPSPKLTFLLGFDTLVRLFSPQYYPSEQAMVQMLQTFLSPDQEDCRIVCAYRQITNNGKTFQEIRDKTFDIAYEFVASNRIALINIGTEEQTYSSSEVRANVAAGDAKWKQLVTSTIASYISERRIYSGPKRE